ncbi:MAG TPA: GntR family transcriptional regulator [Bacillales bacterium]
MYHQLKVFIKEQIESAVWKAEEAIPSERELSELFGISRITVRQAINELVNEGVLFRKRGMGTFVAPPKINQGLSKLSGFTADMQSLGLKPSSKVLNVRNVTASPEIAQKLNIQEEDEIVEIFRLRLADDEPMALERSFLPFDKVKPIMDEPLENRSLYTLLTEKCHLNLAWAKQTIEIGDIGTQGDAELLEVDQNTPVLLIERTTHLDNSEPIEYVVSQYRADRYKFTIEMDI